MENTTTTITSSSLHIFFLPFLSPGHMIPMVDLARMFAARGVKSSVVTTPGNAPLIQPTIDMTDNIQLLILDAPPSAVENTTALPTPELTPEFIAFIDSLRDPFVNLLRQHRPDCVISDVFFPWSAYLGVKRLVFAGTSAFCSVVNPLVSVLRPFLSPSFTVRGIPHRIKMMRSELTVPRGKEVGLSIRMMWSAYRSYGMILNTFYELEPEYAAKLARYTKSWNLGPVSLFDRNALVDKAATRGGGSVSDEKHCSHKLCLNWLDGKESGSILYVCFGSLGRFTRVQLREIAAGLESSGRDFVWVIKKCGDHRAEWMPEGLEERVVGEGKGLIVTGWAPQTLILGHPAVGGFMTHCGWNSCLEGASAGLPMITWPLFTDQFFNEKLLVNVLRIGVPVGSMVSSFDEERRTLVKGEEVKKAVEDLMGSSKDADDRRKRAKAIAGRARKAVQVGGSSYNDMTKLIQELMEAKALRG